MALPMNRLQLVQRLREKSGSTGTGPVSTVNQTGESLRLVNWIDEAWNEIQMASRFWMWMRKDFSFDTAIGKNFYLPSATSGEVGISDFASWHGDTFRLYAAATGRADEQFLVEWSYDTWRDTYDFGIQVAQRPAVWAPRSKDKAILLGPSPDQVYTVTGQYQASPLAMAADTDVPGLPAQFHMLIVYKAMLLYAGYEAAPEVYNEAKAGWRTMYSLLREDQLEEPSFGEPLA